MKISNTLTEAINVTSGDIKRKLIYFRHQVDHKMLVISCGLFVCNWKLLLDVRNLCKVKQFYN